MKKTYEQKLAEALALAKVKYNVLKMLKLKFFEFVCI